MDHKNKNAKACKKHSFCVFSYSETESKTCGVVNEYTVKNENKRCKNNPVTAVLVSVLVMFLLSCLFLLLLAALLYKFDLE